MAFAIHWIVVVGLSIRVIKRRRPVGVSLAWLALIAAAPLVGALFYLLFGENRLGPRRLGRINSQVDAVSRWLAELRKRRADDDSITPAAEPIRRHAEQVPGFPVLGNNQLTLFDNFHAVFDSLVSDIDTAQTSCHLCFYIWHEGGRTDEVVDALVAAAKRGVHCSALADAMGSKIFLKSASAKRLREAGVQLSAALPTGLLRTFFARADLRNHRKIVVVDDAIAYTGSLTIDDSICIFGSVNLDMRSLWLNFEISLFIYDNEFTRRLSSLQQSYIEDSSQLELEVWRQRPAWQRFAEDAFRLTSPLL